MSWTMRSLGAVHAHGRRRMINHVRRASGMLRSPCNTATFIAHSREISDILSCASRQRVPLS